MKAQLASPGFTPVFAALVSVVNTKLPDNGELILKRVIVAFRRAYKRRDKVVATALAKFVAHLVNQQVSEVVVGGGVVGGGSGGGGGGSGGGDGGGGGVGGGVIVVVLVGCSSCCCCRHIGPSP